MKKINRIKINVSACERHGPGLSNCGGRSNDMRHLCENWSVSASGSFGDNRIFGDDDKL